MKRTEKHPIRVLSASIDLPLSRSRVLLLQRFLEKTLWEIDFRRLFAYDSVMEIPGFPSAWVVKCRKCGCIVTCRATDPQADNAQPEKAEPAPQNALIVTCSCCWSSFRYEPDAIFKGPPRPNTSCERYRKADGKSNNALFFAASLIAAVRLNREEIKLSPAVQSKIADSVRLAEMIHRHIERH